MDKHAQAADKAWHSSPRMTDVAKLAGVATSTVSRALANPGRVNEETRRRIAAAAEQLGYIPNTAARNLRVGRSTIVLAALPGPSMIFGASQIIPAVLQGLASTVAEGGFDLIFSNRNSPAAARHVVDLAFGGTVRGVVVLGAADLPAYGSRSLADAGIPVVSLLTDRSAAGIPSVVTNDRAAMREGVLHLIALDHRSFFYIAGESGNYHEVERFSGLLDALAVVGLSDRAVIRHGGHLGFNEGFQNGVEAAHAYLALALARRPTAAVCCADDAAISFIGTVRSNGVAVPEDVSIIGFDGAAVGAFCVPPLTTLEQPAEDLGAQAARIMLDLLGGAAMPAPKTTVPSRLLLRASTATPSGRSER
ncbi:LacI family repressor for deo operon, udp, cdd, tsx, nupC, and nupG [Inquilinus ginsengisoli]|uniref:LacI family repressor for deo operon, udp, cdd, tsx, nupC, and nupG n=1 Tax=Inquilinus ginsengisoli TaxID=363840 RepID=A0ABU1JP12_9PROT|nr:LacI family DNA-binding transcriptional regulator [Inquilinus ginsengisoli]MDR6290360.1 LacI family repressor for deo operon, udp, cdd, tsx, nupC, and nupG [Inquilinus ginsengisoli]